MKEIVKQKLRMKVKLKDFGMGKVMKTHLHFHLRRRMNLH